jgi:hypothetical protein
MTDIQPMGPRSQRSQEYTKLLEELRNSFVSAANMAVRLYEQGKKDGLSNEVIRKDIEVALEGIVKERRLREVLPLELKRSYTLSDSDSDNGNSALSAELDELVKRPTPRYDEVSKKVWKVLNAIRAKYIPEICEALHREQPRLRERGIKNRVAAELMDIYPGIVNDPYLRTWTIPVKHKKAKK